MERCGQAVQFWWTASPVEDLDLSFANEIKCLCYVNKGDGHGCLLFSVLLMELMKDEDYVYHGLCPLPHPGLPYGISSREKPLT